MPNPKLLQQYRNAVLAVEVAKSQVPKTSGRPEMSLALAVSVEARVRYAIQIADEVALREQRPFSWPPLQHENDHLLHPRDAADRGLS